MVVIASLMPVKSMAIATIESPNNKPIILISPELMRQYIQKPMIVSLIRFLMINGGLSLAELDTAEGKNFSVPKNVF